MANVVIYGSGRRMAYEIKRMYDTHGPHLIGSRRLDRLDSATVIRDSSTVTTNAQTVGTGKTSTSGRAVNASVGYLVAGPVGAIIGGGSGTLKQKLATTTVSNQTTNTNVYLQLQFREESIPVTVEAKDERAFQLIQAYAGSLEWTQDQLDQAKEQSAATKAYRVEKIMGEEEVNKKVWVPMMITMSVFTFFMYVFSSSIIAIICLSVVGMLAGVVVYAATAARVRADQRHARVISGEIPANPLQSYRDRGGVDSVRPCP